MGPHAREYRGPYGWMVERYKSQHREGKFSSHNAAIATMENMKSIAEEAVQSPESDAEMATSKEAAGWAEESDEDPTPIVHLDGDDDYEGDSEEERVTSEEY